MALLIPFRGRTPRVAADVFLAPDAVLIGDVTVGSEASIWFGAVLRGDHPENGIVVGPRTSIQDQCVVHVGDWGPTLIGADVTVGHGAKFESCTLGDRTIVGMNAVILQEATVGKECLVAAGAVVLEEAEIPDRSVVAGVPGTVRKTLEGSAARWVEGGGRHYVELSRRYLAEGIGRVSDVDLPTGRDAGKDGEAHPSPSPDSAAGSRCELCGGRGLERHCKIVCLRCGYTRDCSDP